MPRAGRVIVLRDHRIVFLPMPKSGCTSVKWLLASIAGLSREHFAGSQAREVSQALAVHDMDLWGPEFQWSHYDERDQRQMSSEPEWLRLSVVRDPAARVWSAWQSKLLLREPRYVRRFGNEPWFPGTPESLDEMVGSFREFVRALDDTNGGAPRDSHWAPQSELLDGFDPNFLGRAEDPGATTSRIQEHVGMTTLSTADLPRENSNPIPYSPSVYDADSAAVVARLYGTDFATFGYSCPGAKSPAPDHAGPWKDLAEARLPLLAMLVERHLRIGELVEMVRDQKWENARLERRLTRSVERERLTRQAAKL